ncbi:MAG: tetratricopeptide repeat protein [Chloroflexota bacterium]
MTTISLHKYHEQIEHLLDDSQYELAASHCRYILKQYPRHVNTYRLLAKTLLEQGDLGGALEMFQRVLSADPNDYIAHAGLSVVYREEGLLTQSLWHLERAYEIEPYNGAIQQELRGLYVDYMESSSRGKREDMEFVAPERLPVTDGALARLYVNGELYTQAIDVLRRALAEDEDRIDLEVLLVEALWLDNQRIDAVQVCLQVLDKLPNCITANAVLAEIWLQTGRTDEARGYLEHVNELTLMDVFHQDFESPAGRAFRPEGALPLPAVVEVERLGDDADGGSFGGEAGLVGTAVSPATSDEDTAYQWLEGLTGELTLPESETDAPASSMLTTDSDWLKRELESYEETTPGLETAVSPIDTDDWLNDLQASEEEDGINLKAFTAGAAAAGILAGKLADDEKEDADLEDAFMAAEDDPLAWLAEGNSFENIDDSGPLFDQGETTAEVSGKAAEMPDWLADDDKAELELLPMALDDLPGLMMRTYEDSDEAEDETGLDEYDDSYDWLESITEQEPTGALDPGDLDLSQFTEFGKDDKAESSDKEVVWRLTDELNPPEETGEPLTAVEDASFDFEIMPEDLESTLAEEIPDWLMGSSGVDELEVASMKELASEEISNELADWVAANQPDNFQEDSLDWLAQSTEPDSPLEQEPDADEDDDDDFSLDGLPTWMLDSEVSAGDSTFLDSAPLSRANEPVDDSAPLETADLPDWLMGDRLDKDDSSLLGTGSLADEAESPDSSEVKDLPDWLRTDTPETAVPETTAESSSMFDWLLDEPEEIESEEDGPQTAVAGGLLGMFAAGAIAHTLADDDEEAESQPGQPVEDSYLEQVVMEDAVSDKQENLTGPQEEPEKPELPAMDDPDMDDADIFDWLDELEVPATAAADPPMAHSEMDDSLAWMQLDDLETGDGMDFNELLGLGLEEEEPAPAAKAESTPSDLPGLDEDESLDWLDALAEGESEAVDEMPTWQWPEDKEAETTENMVETTSDDGEGVEVPSAAAIAAAASLYEPEEEDFVEDLDDAMSWLEDLAAEPDAPVEELPTIAGDIDLDAMFDTDSDLGVLADLSDESIQTESIDQIFVADTQNDSWLDSLIAGDEEPLPEFLAEDEDADLDAMFGLESEPSAGEIAEAAFDVGEPPEDLDDAMAWLEQLAARQGAPLDELPSVTDQPESQPAPEFDFSLDMEGELGEEELAEPGALPMVHTEEDSFEFDVPDDPDEAMAWLEKLAARQGAPLDELPSVSEDDVIPTIPPVDETLEELDEAMSWLSSLEEDQGFDAFTAEPPEMALSESDELEAFDFDLEQVETPVSEPNELSDALDWLESVTATEAEAVVYNPDDIDVSDDQLAGALDFLALLAVGGAAAAKGGAAAAKVTGSQEDEAPDLFVEEETAVIDLSVAEEIPANIIEEMPEDPDEAMAWLEKLAARQGAPLDELPSVGQDEYDDLAASGAAEAERLALMETEIETETAVDTPFVLSEEEAPDNIEDAMAWLEQLAARQGVSLDELPTVNQDDLEEDVTAPGWITVAQEQEELLDAAEVDAPHDADLAQPAQPAEADVPDVSPDEMNMEDAMAWLEKLAARQGTPLDELPTVDGVSLADDDIDTPAWIARQTGPLDDSTLADLDVLDSLVDDSDDDFFAALENIPAIEGIEREIDPSSEPLSPEAEESDDYMPDWLSGSEGDTGPLGHTGWLNALDEPDMDGWLTAEAEATVMSPSAAVNMPDLADRGDLVQMGGLEETGDLIELEPVKGLYTGELDEARVLADLDLGDFSAGLNQGQLESARSALTSGDINAALNEYQLLVEAGDSMHIVISDLERAAELHRNVPLVRRMLGDAYMRNGQLNKAIETYRQALDQM